MSPVGRGSDVQSVLALRQQVLEKSQALREFKEAREAASTAPAEKGQTSFGDTLRDALHSVSEVQAKSSAMTTAYERGEQHDVAQVMLARQEAGVAFEATLQVRNKLLSAYQDIMRMGV